MFDKCAGYDIIRLPFVCILRQNRKRNINGLTMGEIWNFVESRVCNIIMMFSKVVSVVLL